MGGCQCCKHYDPFGLNLPPAMRISSRDYCEKPSLHFPASATEPAASPLDVLMPRAVKGLDGDHVVEQMEYEPVTPEAELSDADDEVACPRSPEHTVEEIAQAFMVFEGTVSLAPMGKPCLGRMLRAVSHVEVGPSSLPDFRGTWKMTHFLGDFDAFMKEMGIGWALRKAASTLRYGANSTFHTIKQEADVFTCTTKNPKGVFVRTLVINGEEQDDVDPVDNKPLTVIPSWDGIAIHVTCRVKDGTDMPLTRRYLEQDMMVVEQTSPKGVSVKRFFVKA
mmetsp:Transcript_43746/g.95228  ORF Transcript_43746/g.95228 Transcript_43746/m.95228 type:complete len:279 (+) Transcript_43746:95-931(+)